MLDAEKAAEQTEELYAVDRVGGQPDRWSLHRASKAGEEAVVETLGEFGAFALYRQLAEADLPDSWHDEAELKRMGLPTQLNAYWDEVAARLPGISLGSAGVAGSVSEWRVEFSFTWDGAAGWNLHRCGEPEVFTDPPNIETEWSLTKALLLATAEEYDLDPDDIAQEIQKLRNRPTELAKIRLDPVPR